MVMWLFNGDACHGSCSGYVDNYVVVMFAKGGVN